MPYQNGTCIDSNSNNNKYIYNTKIIFVHKSNIKALISSQVNPLHSL